MTNLAASYAEALYMLAAEEGISESVLNDLEEICILLGENKDYIRLANESQINFETKKQLLDEAFLNNTEKYTLNFLKILAKKKIFHIIFDCKKEFEKRYNADNGIENVSCISAGELTKELKDKLKDKLEDMTKKKVNITYKTDKSVMGGLVIRFGDIQIDASLKTKLENLKKQLSAN